MQTRFFVAHQGRQMGPMEFAEIEKQLLQKQLYPTDYVYVTDEKPRWLPILDFILVHGPKKKVVAATLQTEGARHAGDSEVDWLRFASGLPMVSSPATEATDPALAKQIYPTAVPPQPVQPQAPIDVLKRPVDALKPPMDFEITKTSEKPAPNFPPPPKPPRAIIEKRILEAAVRRPPAPKRPPVPTPPQAPQVDVSATAQVNVLPPKATKLHIQIHGEARVGEFLEVTVHAIAESGTLDTTFDEIVHLGCSRPVQGLSPLQFSEGIARTQVRCLASGQHQFFLSLDTKRQSTQTNLNYQTRPGAPIVV